MLNRRHLTRALVALTALALPVFLAACDLGLAEELVEKAQADKLLAASVLATPEYDLSGTIDSYLPDGGTQDDAGTSEGDDDEGMLPQKVPGQVTANVFFAQQSVTEPAPKGIAKAKVTLSYGGKTFQLEDKGGGNYALTNQDDENFVYQPGTEYVLKLVHEGTTYEARVTSPSEQKVAEFHATPGKPIEVGVKRTLKLTRENAEDIAFTTVVPMSASGKGEPTWSDFPTDPMQLLELVAADEKWRQSTITVPGEAFPTGDTVYLISVNTVKKAETSNNLRLGSVMLVGTADIGAAKTP